MIRFLTVADGSLPCGLCKPASYDKAPYYACVIDMCVPGFVCPAVLVVVIKSCTTYTDRHREQESQKQWRQMPHPRRP